MQGWILYSRKMSELQPSDYGVNRLLEAAKAKNVAMHVYKPEEFDLIVTRDDRRSILINGKETDLPDFIIPRLGSNTTYYTLAVIRHMQRLGVYACNGADTIALVKDKLHMHQVLAENHLPTPKTMLVRFPVEIQTVTREIGFPLVVKNITGTEGKGIYLAETAEKFIDLMELIYTNNKSANIILQEFIATSYGKDLRVFVVGGRVVGCMKRYSETSFKANFSRGGKVDHYTLTPEIEWLATETARLVNLDITGIDLLFDKNEFKICEANSAPGFKGLEKVVGNVVAEHIMEYIYLKVSRFSL
jgi:RimK family alpha-L-glutamate ligase